MNVYLKAALLPIVVSVFALPIQASAAEDNDAEIRELRQLIDAMRSDYESRLGELEKRLNAAERSASGARRDAKEAVDLAEQTAIDQSSGSSAANAFNPALGVVLGGRIGRVDAGWDHIPGFLPAGEIGTGDSGFAVGEAEINLKANVDSVFFGNLTLAVHEHDGDTELELEEAWFQTTSLPAGLTVLAGRLFSSAGYLNSMHSHVDDFVDRPLPYQAFLGSRYTVDGIRASWIAPTALLLEIGTELNWGDGLPATANHTRSPGTWTAYVKLGGDAGLSNSWQVGLAQINADVRERGAGHGHDEHDEPSASFTGDSDLTVADFIWKWAPQGNSSTTSLKVQGEYFRRNETGVFDTLLYDGDQTGWYLQGVWQFARQWRIGLRHDVVDADNGANFAGTDLETPTSRARRNSLMVDWSPSEFSRLRLQYARDHVLQDPGNVWYLQYIMGIGAHGAHQF